MTAVDILGGEKVLGRSIQRPFGLTDRIRAGFPYASLERLQKTLALSREETAASLSIPIRTLARRKRERHLTAEESDRLYRVARLLAHAADVLGSEHAAAEWFRTPHVALNMTAPLSLVDTEAGAIQVDEILGRIEFGMYS
jgi:putative toxin-antitoxin system antitoxin component (TIGR02293 family)